MLRMGMMHFLNHGFGCNFLAGRNLVRYFCEHYFESVWLLRRGLEVLNGVLGALITFSHEI